MSKTGTPGAVALVPTPSKSVPESYVQAFKSLGDMTRLNMIRLIGSLEEYPCTSLEHELPVGKSTISYHVKILNHAGLISVRRQGRHFFYSLNRDVLDFYAPSLLERLAAEHAAAERGEEPASPAASSVRAG